MVIRPQCLRRSRSLALSIWILRIRRIAWGVVDSECGWSSAKEPLHEIKYLLPVGSHVILIKEELYRGYEP